MKNKLKKIFTENKNILGFLCLFVIIQPFLDIQPLFENEKYQIFGFTIPTLVRCIFIGILSLLCIKKLNKKNYKYIFIYFIVLLVYTYLHNQAANSIEDIPNNYIYSFTSELFYIIRMLLPISIIYFTSKSNIKYKEFIDTIIISSAIIGTIIFIGNTFYISYVSYGSGYTVCNWLQWFTGEIENYPFEELTSKGWFYMANQASGLMILLLPFNLYEYIMNRTKISCYSTLILIISMIMIGTRTAAYGWLMIVICTIVIYLFLKYILKSKFLQEKKIAGLLVIGLIGIIFLYVSPINQRNYGYELGTPSKTRPSITENVDYDEIYKYIEDNYQEFGIQTVYIKNIYNYKYDPEFWYYIFDYSIENGVIENREMEMLITKRIVQKNNNLKYKLFGYSFSRMRNANLYIEHDFIAQYYTMGILGVILLIGPYIVIILLMIIKIFKKIKKKVNFHDIIFMMSITATLCVSIITGHILDELFVTIYIGFICGYFYDKVNRKLIKKGEQHE